MADTLEQRIDDAKTEGWELKSRSNERVVLIRRKTGTIVAHIIIFIFFGWWTLGLANLTYFAYKYFFDVDKRVLRADDDSH